jgi:predicted patatin/cPLA2 family phospholipase
VAAVGGDAGGARRRSLVLAGGGVKVAFQAGVLQVWLDEAGLEFDHADGASGGVFNLAMWCQGQSGRQIADNWRATRPSRGIDLNWRQYPRGPYARSLLTLDRYRRNVFPAWGLDFDKLRATDRVATFNVYNFSRNRLEVRTADQMSEDLLVAAVSLPMWFPPVVIDGDTYIDAVYITDANVEEAIRRGADELWIIWTVSQRRVWRDGFVANYFQIIETAANGHLARVLGRIEASNAAIERGEQGEFGRPIQVRCLAAEVPLHYLINLSQDRLAEAVNLGVRAARRWCRDNGVPLRPPAGDSPGGTTRLRFTEQMKGYVEFGETDFRQGSSAGWESGNYLAVRLTIDIHGMDRFVLEPDHEASVTGWVECEALGGRRRVEEGTFNLLVFDDDPARQRMLYRLYFSDGVDRPLTLSGYKEVSDDPGRDLWSDTTTLHTRVLRGHVDAAGEADAQVVAAGIIRIRPGDFARQLTTFRVQAPSLAGRAATLGRFGRLFLGKLWDVYGQGVLSSSPL